MGTIDFFNGMKDLATITDDGELINGGKTSAQIIQECNESAHIPSRFSTARFTDHDDIIYSKNGYTDNVTQAFKGFCLNPKTDKVFGLSGPTGTGKTTLACAGVHERAIVGLPTGLYLSCRTLKPMIMTSRSFKASESEMDIYNKYATTPFLILDEIGKCSDAAMEWDFVTTIFAMRYDNEKPTVFTTNFSYEQFRTFILSEFNKGIDIYDRLQASLIAKVMNGTSFRGKK